MNNENTYGADEMHQLEITKTHQLFKPLYWIGKAVYRGNKIKPALENIHVEANRIVATDGHRLHTYYTNNHGLQVGQYHLDKFTKGKIIITLDKDPISPYPNVESVWPDITDFPTVDFDVTTRMVRGTYSTNESHVAFARIIRVLSEAYAFNYNYFDDMISIEDLKTAALNPGAGASVFFDTTGTYQALMMPIRVKR